MPLDPAVQALRDRRERDDVAPLYEMTLDEAREADLASIRADAGDPEPVYRVYDRGLPGPAGRLPVRIYRSRRRGPSPALVYFFGGGWTLGNIDTSDAICRSLANAAGCTVITPGYRLAPEAKFPAAVQDCYAATVWVAANAHRLGVDPTRVAVGGDSAGGNLAAAVTLLARDSGDLDLVGQVLVYPNTDHLADDESMRASTDRYLFNRTSVAWYWGHYLARKADGRNPLASPLRAHSHAGLPPALILTAEYDPLRDQGERYARKLARAGVPVQATRYEGMTHGFFAMAGTLDAGKQAITQTAETLRAWFTSAGGRA